MSKHAEPEPVVAHIVVKFLDGHAPPYPGDSATPVHGTGPAWSELAAEFPDVRLRPMFTSAEPQRIRDLVAQGRRQDRTYEPPNLLSYFVVDVSKISVAARLQQIVRHLP